MCVCEGGECRWVWVWVWVWGGVLFCVYMCLCMRVCRHVLIPACMHKAKSQSGLTHEICIPT